MANVTPSMFAGHPPRRTLPQRQRKQIPRPLGDLTSAQISNSSRGVLHGFVPGFAPLVEIGVGRVPEQLPRSVVEDVGALTLGNQRAVGPPHAGTEIKPNGLLGGFCMACVFAAGNEYLGRSWHGEIWLILADGRLVFAFGNGTAVYEMAAFFETETQFIGHRRLPLTFVARLG